MLKVTVLVGPFEEVVEQLKPLLPSSAHLRRPNETASPYIAGPESPGHVADKVVSARTHGNVCVASGIAILRQRLDP